MAAVTICSDFGAKKKKKSDTVSTVSPSFRMKWWDQMPWSSFSECWALIHYYVWNRQLMRIYSIAQGLYSMICSYLTRKEIYKKRGVCIREAGNRTGSLLREGLYLGPDCGLWAICPVSMEMTYQLEIQAPGRKSPKALYRLKEYPNYLCNPVESYILLCLLGYDHRPIDHCLVITT